MKNEICDFQKYLKELPQDQWLQKKSKTNKQRNESNENK